MSYIERFDVQAADSPSVDAFGRWRVSNPETIFDSKQLHDDLPLFWDDQELSGSGTSSTHSTDAARTRIAVTASTAGVRARQTFQRFNYQPGKSQLMFLTFYCPQTTGTTKRIGVFDDDGTGNNLTPIDPCRCFSMPLILL